MVLPDSRSHTYLLVISLPRFAPHLGVLNYSAGKDAREEQREEIVELISSQVRDRGFISFLASKSQLHVIPPLKQGHLPNQGTLLSLVLSVLEGSSNQPCWFSSSL